jgi:hypothetical protein
MMKAVLSRIRSRVRETYMKLRLSLSAERLRELLHYDYETGVFTWRRRTHTFRLSFNTRLAGHGAGRWDKFGYGRIGIDYSEYLIHRLAWLYMTGEWPAACIDHIDCNPANNKWSNLRQATVSQNGWNQRLHSKNTSGFKGVSFHKSSGRYRADIQLNGKQMSIGAFNTPEEAHKAYCEAALEHYGEYARVR